MKIMKISKQYGNKNNDNNKKKMRNGTMCNGYIEITVLLKQIYSYT